LRIETNDEECRNERLFLKNSKMRLFQHSQMMDFRFEVAAVIKIDKLAPQKRRIK
jgi:hypothetical protein